MNLEKKEATEFLNLYIPLLMYVAQKTGELSSSATKQDFFNCSMEKKVDWRSTLFADAPKWIDSFISENPFGFSKGQLQKVAGFKEFILEKFLVVGKTKDSVLFMQGETVYAAKLLFDSIPAGKRDVPYLLECSLLAFNDKIVCDGLYRQYGLSFGSTMAKSIISEAEESMVKKGIVSQFGKAATPSSNSNKDEELLRFYMKSKTNRDRYWEEIEDLSAKSQALKSVYINELGRINARTIKKTLKEIGHKSKYVALYLDAIIAFGKNADEVKTEAMRQIDKQYTEAVYYFKL